MPDQRPQPPAPGPPTPARRWKRTAAAAALLLLAGGAIVNVAVAWGCAVFSPPISSTPLMLNAMPATAFSWGDQEVQNASWIMEHLPPYHQPARGYTVGGLGVDIDRVGGIGAFFSVPSIDFFAERILTGLPTRCLSGVRWESEQWWDPSTELTEISDAPIVRSGGGGLFLLDRFSRPRAIPYAVVLPGFIINTLFYALLLWLLFFVPFAARRMLRRKRGLCEKCAYPIGTWGVSPVCTECGAAVREKDAP